MEKIRRSAGSVLHVVPGADDALQAEYKFVRMGTTQDACDHKIYTEIGMVLTCSRALG